MDNGKLVSYCLSPSHLRGRHKARHFQSRLGLGSEDADRLKVALLKAASSRDDAEPGERDEFGQRYILDLVMQGPDGEVTVRSHWIVRSGENYPRFLTCSVKT